MRLLAPANGDQGVNRLQMFSGYDIGYADGGASAGKYLGTQGLL